MKEAAGRLATGVRECLVVMAFVAATVLHTWPIAGDPSGLLPRNTDTLVHVWALDEMSHQLVTAPWRLFDARTFHPYPDTLASVDHVFADAVLAAPLRLFTEDSVLVYNIVLLATFVLSGWFTYRLVRALTESTAAGLLSGCAFAYATVRWHQLPHLHLLSAQWLPLALLSLHRALAAPSLKTGAAFAAAGVLVALSSWHMALLGAVATIVVATWTLASQRGALLPRLTLLGAAGAVVLVSVLPFAAVYARVADEWRPASTVDGRLQELSSLSLKVEGLIATPPSGRGPYAQALSRFTSGESQAFPGVVILAFALVAVLAGRGSRRSTPASRAAWIVAGGLLAATCVAVVFAQSGRHWVAGGLAAMAPIVCLSVTFGLAGLTSARAHAPRSSDPPLPALGSPVPLTLTYAALAIAGLLLALGPHVEAMGVSLGTGIYREDWMPLLSMIRVPARFVLLTALGGAVLAGLGLKWLLDRLPVRAAALVAAVALVFFNLEMRHAPLDVRFAPQPRPVDTWLVGLKEPGAVVEYPVRQSLWAVQSGLYHRRPMVNGIGYLQPPAFLELQGDDDLSPRQLEILWEHFHPRFVVLDGERYEKAEYERMVAVAQQPGTLELRWQLGRTRVLELIDRGEGPVLFRRWPRTALESHPTLAFSASVSGGQPGMISTLTVELNGKRLLERQAQDATTVNSYELALPREALVTGSNVVEIRGDYRHANAARAVPVGTTGVALAADASIMSTHNRSFIRVNGRQMPVDKGYALVVVDPVSGAITSAGRFNTSWYAEESERMVAFIDRIPAGAVVLVATEFDVSRRLTASAVAALGQLGLTADLTKRFGWQQAAAGVKGARPGTALEFVGEGTRTLTLGATEERRVQLEGLVLR